jgi:hypothetical protein
MWLEPGMKLTSITLLMLPCLVLSSSLNVGGWLFRLVGFTHDEKRGDGYRVNVGRQLLWDSGRFIGLGAAISFGFTFFKSPAGIAEGFAAILIVLIFCAPSTLFSYYLIKKKHIERMKRQFRNRLEDCFGHSLP